MEEISGEGLIFYLCLMLIGTFKSRDNRTHLRSTKCVKQSDWKFI